MEGRRHLAHRATGIDDAHIGYARNATLKVAFVKNGDGPVPYRGSDVRMSVGVDTRKRHEEIPLPDFARIVLDAIDHWIFRSKGSRAGKTSEKG